MKPTSEELWGAIRDISFEEPTVPDIAQPIIDRLLELNIVERKATGLPVLTEYGRRCFSAAEGGHDLYVPGLDNPELAESFPALRP